MASPVTMDLPVLKTQHGQAGKVRAELDLFALRGLLRNHRVQHCIVERATARPGQGVTSMFRFGEAAGAVTGLLVGLGIPHSIVTPRDWQRHHRIGGAPDAARQRALELHPELADQLRRKKDSHRADAVLLAMYGMYGMVPVAAPASATVTPIRQAASRHASG
jgi:hypothetical protein